MEKITYYLIRETLLGKRDQAGDHLYGEGAWKPDVRNVIRDHLIGYDPYEPDDSPYKTGNLSIMDEIEEITEQEAVKLINEQIIDRLKDKWKKEFASRKEKWDKDPGWPAKLVESQFTLNGNRYTIKPNDLGLDDDCWDQGFMETIQGDLSKDLEESGATDICNFGFLD